MASFLLLFTTAILVPILAAALFLYCVDPFDPAPFPAHELARNQVTVVAPRVDRRMLQRSDNVGQGRVVGPEDIAYEPMSRVLYTGCVDGWIKRVKMDDSGSGSQALVEDWVNTGGRPLGLFVTNNNNGTEVIVADAFKGLLKITENKEVKLLTDEAEGQRFKFTDGVDVAKDDTIYFTDASFRYNFHQFLYDILECRPHGRLLSFNPNTGETKVLLRDLYFPNGVAISPDQSSLIFCETPLKRCRRYWIKGSRRGSSDAFIENLPGFPDNIHMDDQSNYLIAISSWLPRFLDQLRRNQLVRKTLAIIDRYISSLQFLQKYGGIFIVDLEGKPTAHFYDPAMSQITSGIKVKDHLYIGSLDYQHIIRFNLSNS